MMNRLMSPITLLWPGVAFIGVFFVYPLTGILWRSIAGEPLTLVHYTDLLHEPVYLQIMVNTFQIAFIVTVVCLILGYPLAYFLSSLEKKKANVLMIFVIIPYFTSSLVRTYAWIVLLGREGVINNILLQWQVIQEPLPLMYNRFGVVVGISYILLPYMVLSIYSVLRGIDRALFRAAESLGAGNRQIFHRILLPLSMPGIAGGSMLTFIFALGYFMTPALMGGTQDTMIAMVIDNQVEVVMDWGFASALSVVLLASTLAGLFAYNRLLGIEQLFEGKRS